MARLRAKMVRVKPREGQGILSFFLVSKTLDIRFIVLNFAVPQRHFYSASAICNEKMTAQLKGIAHQAGEDHNPWIEGSGAHI